MVYGLWTHSGGATGGKDIIVAVTDEVEGHTVYGVPVFLFDAALSQRHHTLSCNRVLSMSVLRECIRKPRWHEHAATYLFVSL